MEGSPRHSRGVGGGERGGGGGARAGGGETRRGHRDETQRGIWYLTIPSWRSRWQRRRERGGARTTSLHRNGRIESPPAF